MDINLTTEEAKELLNEAKNLAQNLIYRMECTPAPEQPKDIDPPKNITIDRFCILAYCSMYKEWARSCSEFKDTIAHGEKLPRDLICPNCGKRVAVEITYDVLKNVS